MNAYEAETSLEFGDLVLVRARVIEHGLSCKRIVDKDGELLVSIYNSLGVASLVHVRVEDVVSIGAKKGVEA